MRSLAAAVRRAALGQRLRAWALAAPLVTLIFVSFFASILVLPLGLTHHRLDLMYSRAGLILTMAGIQLSFTLLPIYSVLRGIPSSQMRAAYSLGARPFAAFRRVYLPQALPGVLVGSLLTFILCLGYYITPALVGGPNDQLVRKFIADCRRHADDVGFHPAAGRGSGVASAGSATHASGIGRY
jgi:ABC-type spermidine/putrescine transport system permease subunit I